MALSKSQKEEVIAKVSDLLDQSKMTVIAKYQGIDVKSLQELRKQAKDGGTTVKVIKNRLVKEALKASDKLKAVDSSRLEGMLLYAFNPEDEVAAAQSLNVFAKKNPDLQFIGAISGEAKLLEADEVKVLANLPSKNQLLSGLINTLNSPVNSLMSSISGSSLHNLLASLTPKN